MVYTWISTYLSHKVKSCYKWDGNKLQMLSLKLLCLNLISYLDLYTIFNVFHFYISQWFPKGFLLDRNIIVLEHPHSSFIFISQLTIQLSHGKKKIFSIIYIYLWFTCCYKFYSNCSHQVVFYIANFKIS